MTAVELANWAYWNRTPRNNRLGAKWWVNRSMRSATRRAIAQLKRAGMVADGGRLNRKKLYHLAGVIVGRPRRRTVGATASVFEDRAWKRSSETWRSASPEKWPPRRTVCERHRAPAPEAVRPDCGIIDLIDTAKASSEARRSKKTINEWCRTHPIDGDKGFAAAQQTNM